MFNFEYLIFALTSLVVMSAMFFDFKCRRIPNKIVLPAILLGIVVNTIHSGVNGLFTATVGFMVGGCFLSVFYLMGGMGAGDVKLMAAVGAFLGMEKIIIVLFLTALVGALMAFYTIITHFLQKPILDKLFHQDSLSMNVTPHAVNPLKKSIPYGVAIAMGTLGTLLLILLK